MNFIKEHVRLNASITQGMRFFLIESQIEKWLGTPVCVENKLGGKYHLQLSHGNDTWQSHTEILQKDFEKYIKFDMMSPEGSRTGPVEVYFMTCTSKTDYCTEIHVLHHGLSSDQLLFFKEFWKTKLNKLRYLCNGDWVIEDRDLILSVLKSGL